MPGLFPGKCLVMPGQMHAWAYSWAYSWANSWANAWAYTWATFLLDLRMPELFQAYAWAFCPGSFCPGTYELITHSHFALENVWADITGHTTHPHLAPDMGMLTHPSACFCIIWANVWAIQMLGAFTWRECPSIVKG